jgi:hypothetical protein
LVIATAVGRFLGSIVFGDFDPGVSLRSTPGRGPQPSISAGVEDFMLAAAPRALAPGTQYKKFCKVREAARQRADSAERFEMLDNFGIKNR